MPKQVYVNQLHPNKYGVEKNRKFVELMHKSRSLREVTRFFDFLNCNISFRRQPDKTMTLDKFLGLIDSSSFITLQLASPSPWEIRYGIRTNDKDDRETERFVFIECPYNARNFRAVSRMYRKAFDKNLEDELVPDGLLKHYHEMLVSYPKPRRFK
jgi:hypothetical protein